MLGFAHSWILVFGVLALLPWLRFGQPVLDYPALGLIPRDRLSEWLSVAGRVCAALTALGLVVGLAGPYRREQIVERIGTGAHIVLLIDRSSSMNENFSGRYLGGQAQESKSHVARRLIAEFVERREHDLFAMVNFSTAPIYAMPLTQDRTAVLSAIRASGERGHGVTNIGSGLAMALDFFRGQPHTGSRVILLVSDGAARLEDDTRGLLRQWFADTGTALYWVYLRNPNSARLEVPPMNPNESTTPEFFIHEFFKSLGVPYKAFEADSPDALESAIHTVEALQNQPLRYGEKLPRQDLSLLAFAIAAGAAAISLAMVAVERRSLPT